MEKMDDPQLDTKEEISKFIIKYSKNFSNISVRDIILWIEFINSTRDLIGIKNSIYHGACMVYIDSIEDIKMQKRLLRKLEQMLNIDAEHAFFTSSESLVIDENYIQAGDFRHKRNPLTATTPKNFTFKGTTFKNLQRILRALSLPMTKAILLEGAPGVGKTSIVVNLANLLGQDFVRINLSEQSDISELFGSDLPVEGKAGYFEWKDGPLLAALKAGKWIILDELNLANQSVLEGLNSILDHRGKIYISELNKTIELQQDDSSKTVIFGCQNPLNQGGGRKGLPISFLNRFSKVWFEELKTNDFLAILEENFPDIEYELRKKAILFTQQLNQKIIKNREFGQKGSPWEFNLRDLFKIFSVISEYYKIDSDESRRNIKIKEAFSFTYYCRLRSKKDRNKLRSLFKDIFGFELYVPTGKISCLYENCDDPKFKIGQSTILSTVSNQAEQELVLSSQLPSLEALNFALQPALKNYVPILIGPIHSGKSTLIKLLAKFYNRKLRIINANTSMDATELLGSFEQDNKQRFVKECLERYVPEGMLKNMRNFDELLEYLPDHLHEYYNLVIKGSNGHKPKLNDSGDSSQEGAFRWIDSDLIKGIEDGSWVLIDDANACPAAVLDRLNALVEPGGVMFLPECGNNQRIVKPHENFRLLLAYDPESSTAIGKSGGCAGDISRAMRNRGSEIYLLENWCESSRDFAEYKRFFKMEAEDGRSQEVSMMKNLNLNEQELDQDMLDTGESTNAQIYNFSKAGLYSRLFEIFNQFPNSPESFYCNLALNLCGELDEKFPVDLKDRLELCSLNDQNKSKFIETQFQHLLEFDDNLFITSKFEMYAWLKLIENIKNGPKMSIEQKDIYSNFIISKLINYLKTNLPNLYQSDQILISAINKFTLTCKYNLANTSEKCVSEISEKCLYINKNLKQYLSDDNCLRILEKAGVLLKFPKKADYGNLYSKLKLLDSSYNNQTESNKFDSAADYEYSENFIDQVHGHVMSDSSAKAILPKSAASNSSLNLEDPDSKIKSNLAKLEAILFDYPVLLKNFKNIFNQIENNFPIFQKDFLIPITSKTCYEIRLINDPELIISPEKGLKYFDFHQNIKNYIFVYGREMKNQEAIAGTDFSVFDLDDMGREVQDLSSFKLSTNKVELYDLALPFLLKQCSGLEDILKRADENEACTLDSVSANSATDLSVINSKLLSSSHDPLKVLSPNDKCDFITCKSINFSRLETQVINFNETTMTDKKIINKSLMANFACLKSDQNNTIQQLERFLNNYKITLKNAGKYVNFINLNLENLKNILGENFGNLEKCVLSGLNVAIEPQQQEVAQSGGHKLLKYAKKLENYSKYLINKFLPLPEIDPSEQNLIFYKKLQILLSEYQTFLKVVLKYYNLEYCCEMEEVLNFEELNFYKIRENLREEIGNVEEKIAKIKIPEGADGNGDISFNENYQVIKNLINNFYFKFFYLGGLADWCVC